MNKKIFALSLIFSFLNLYVHAGNIQILFPVFDSKPAFSQEDNEIIYADTIGHWCNVYAKELYREGIFTGIKIGESYYFSPDEHITRGEFLLYLNAILHLLPTDDTALPFADTELIPIWQLPTVTAMYRYGYINGNIEKNKLFFNCDEKISRLECAIILNNMLGLENTESSTGYYDNYLIPEYAVTSIKNITDYGLMQGFEDNSFRPYIKITRGMLADILCKLKDYLSQVDKLK